jgi:hypothetical protein
LIQIECNINSTPPTFFIDQIYSQPQVGHLQ